MFRTYIIVFSLAFFISIFNAHAQVCNELVKICNDNSINSITIDDSTNYKFYFDTCVGINDFEYSNVEWYLLNIKQDGTLAFELTSSGSEFYFIIWGPNPDCSTVLSDYPIRAGLDDDSPTIGLSDSDPDTCAVPGDSDGFVNSINAVKGEQYILAIIRNAGNASTTADLKWTGTSQIDCTTRLNINLCYGDYIPNVPTGDYYEWYPGLETTQSIQVFNDGVYTVSVQDSSFTTIEQLEYTVTVYEEPQVQLPLSVPVFCSDNPVTLDGTPTNISDMNTSEVTYQWFLNNAAITGATQYDYAPIQSGDYYVEVSNNGVCVNASNTVSIVVEQPPDAGSNGTLEICQGDTFTTTNLFNALDGTPDSGGTWSPTIPVVGQNVYTVTGNTPCGNASSTVTVSEVNISAITVGPFDICDNQKNNIVLNDYSSQIINGQPNVSVSYFSDPSRTTLIDPNISYTFNSTTQSQTIYYTIEHNTLTCTAEGTFDLILLDPISLPAFAQNDYYFCTNSSVFVSPDNATIDTSLYTYTWEDANGLVIPSDPTIIEADISQAGIYHLVVESSGCVDSVTVEVFESGMSTLTEEDLEIIESNGENILIIPQGQYGLGDYVYSIDSSDDLDFIADTTFSGIDPGMHTLYIKDLNGCATKSIEFWVINFMKFFTPNGDGQNDYWHINNQPDSELYIYDRFGKLLSKISPQDIGWDGTYNGFPLPSDDYWYKIFMSDGTEKTGHFSLIRR